MADLPGTDRMLADLTLATISDQQLRLAEACIRRQVVEETEQLAALQAPYASGSGRRDQTTGKPKALQRLARNSLRDAKSR